MVYTAIKYIDGLAQGGRNAIANALDLPQSCTKFVHFHFSSIFWIIVALSLCCSPFFVFMAWNKLTVSVSASHPGNL